MARETFHVSPETHERILTLAAAFVASIPHAEIVKLLETGPSAVGSRCFRWAFDAARELEEVERIDPTSGASLHAAAPWVRILQAAAFDRIATVHGHPRVPALPELPEGLVVDSVPAAPDGEEPRMSSAARLLCSTVRYARMGGGDAMYHYITSNRARDRWVLWSQYECDMEGRDITTPELWCPRTKAVSEHDAAVVLLKAYWEFLRDSYGLESPNEWSAYHVISNDELAVIDEAVWPTEDETS